MGGFKYVYSPYAYREMGRHILRHICISMYLNPPSPTMHTVLGQPFRRELAIDSGADEVTSHQMMVETFRIT